MPIGYLMIEHRLIERMIKLMTDELGRMNKTNKANLVFLNAAIDFLKTYADKCHHGKEEDIFFRDLYRKKLSREHKKAVDTLIEEHKMGRKAVAKLIDAKDKHSQGVLGAIKSIKLKLKWLIGFYPRHIAKEDKSFFIPSMAYFSEKEQNNMLREFCVFDNSGIQETYRNIVQALEKKK